MVMLNSPVEFDALLAHGESPARRRERLSSSVRPSIFIKEKLSAFSDRFNAWRRCAARDDENDYPGSIKGIDELIPAPFARDVGSHRAKASTSAYFFFAGPKSGCQAASLRLGAAAITFAFSFFGFLASRLPRCCPLAMMSISNWGLSSSSLGWNMRCGRHNDADAHVALVPSSSKAHHDRFSAPRRKWRLRDRFSL